MQIERSETWVCNAAIAKIAVHLPVLTDVVTDTTRTAEKFKLVYPLARDALLRENDFNFASRRASLPALSDAPEWGFSYQYTLPNDYIAIREVQGSDPVNYPYEIASLDDVGLVIATNLGAPLYIRYTALIDNLAFWDPMSLDALVNRVGVDMAYALTGKRSVAEDLALIFQNRVDASKERDAQEGISNIMIPDGSWLSAR